MVFIKKIVTIFKIFEEYCTRVNKQSLSSFIIELYFENIDIVMVSIYFLLYFLLFQCRFSGRFSLEQKKNATGGGIRGD